jgi:8-oxo-dGTP pyrophosphatase MutT (NUDIX family)
MERYAAVLIPIYAAPPHDVVFIERGHHLRRHAGEIGFPGGAVDESDAGDHERAALREAHEEIGIVPARVDVVARLRAVRQRVNVFTVTPFVGVVRGDEPPVADGDEVAATHRVPLGAIVAPGAVHLGVEVSGERRVETFQFDYDGLHVWGLTGRILDLFVTDYHASDSPLRAALTAGFAGRD